MIKDDIKIIEIRYLNGPNMWTYRPVIEAVVDIGNLEDFPSNKIPGLYERLVAWLPGLVEHRCGVGRRGGFLERLREGTWSAHILEHVTIELQNLAGMQSGFGKARQTSRPGVYKVVVRSRQKEVSIACMRAGRDLLMAAINDQPYALDATLIHLRDLADRLMLGPSTACIVEAATDRRIPSIRLTAGNLVQLGYGASQRRIWTAETDQTSAIAESISSDKDLTKQLLKSCGVPVPSGRIVESPEDAWSAAEDLGMPVVVKPSDANHARGVSLELRTREQVEAAFAVAAEEGSDVIVEQFIRGSEHRLLVVGGRVAAAARGEIVQVVGDGSSTVTQLIDTQINTDPRRGRSEEFPLDLVLLDEDASLRLEIERQGYQPDSIPPAGARITVQRTGVVAFDCTDEVHPSVAAAACLAARVVGLDIAGIDLVTENVARPLQETGGAIVEVNAGPGLLMHLKPASGEPRPVGRAIVDHLFPPSASGRVPVVGVTGTRGTTLVTRLIGRLLYLSGKHISMACGDGMFMHRRRVYSGDCANWASAHKVLVNRSTEAAIIENGPHSIASEGLAYDRCQVGVVTELDPDSTLPDLYLDTPEHLYNLLRTQVDVVLEGGAAVLNAQDGRVAEMAGLCDGEVIFFSLDAEHPVVVEHLAKGGRAVLMKEGRLIFARGEDADDLGPLPNARRARPDAEPLPPQDVLAAAAAAWALGVPNDLIGAGMETFDPKPLAKPWARKTEPATQPA
ncbi:MAG: cyanophycin synthetase [Rhodocyclaceae bacterium]|nr:cyanophycin synthetase [Rhodocyclaceae bacterium]